MLHNDTPCNSTPYRITVSHRIDREVAPSILLFRTCKIFPLWHTK